MNRKCKYTKAEIVAQLDQTPLERLYQSEVVKYRSTVQDGNESVMDVISGWLLEDGRFAEWCQSVVRHSVKRIASEKENAYNILGDGHFKDPEKQKSSKKQNEVWLAKRLHQLSTKLAVGKPLNFEVPLSDNAGRHVEAIADAVDLVCYDACNNTLNLVELKQAYNSKESLLRCIVEVFTYYLLIRDKLFFVRDFMRDRDGICTGVRADARVSVAVLVPPGSAAGKDLGEYLNDARNLSKVKMLVSEIEKTLNKDWKSEDLKVGFEFLDHLPRIATAM